MNQRSPSRRHLFLLPFDHRESFRKDIFGIQNRSPTPQEIDGIKHYKKIIYEGFKKALQNGVPTESSGILVDEQFGDSILSDAIKNGFLTACPVETSGESEFRFEYGEHFGEHIQKYFSTYSKVLVRLNPEASPTANQIQIARLQTLSEYLYKNKQKLMFELLIPPTEAQLKKTDHNLDRYEQEIRPASTLKAMKMIQDAGIDVDIWKVEGLDRREDCIMLSAQARFGKSARGQSRSNVALITLGRGESIEKVKSWLKTAATVPGYIGFAIGRTVFLEPLKALHEKRISEISAIDRIAANFKNYCDLWLSFERTSN